MDGVLESRPFCNVLDKVQIVYRFTEFISKLGRLNGLFAMIFFLFLFRVDATPAVVLSGPNPGNSVPLGVLIKYEPRWLDPVTMGAFGATFNISFTTADAFLDGKFLLRFKFTSPGTKVKEAWGSWSVVEMPLGGWYQLQPKIGELTMDASSMVYFSFNGEADTKEADLGKRLGVDQVEFQPMMSTGIFGDASTTAQGPTVYRLEPAEFSYVGVAAALPPAAFGTFLGTNRDATVVPISIKDTREGGNVKKRPVTEQFLGGILVGSLLTVFILAQLTACLWSVSVRAKTNRRRKQFEHVLESGFMRSNTSSDGTFTVGRPDIDMQKDADIAPLEIYDRTIHNPLGRLTQIGTMRYSRYSATSNVPPMPLKSPQGFMMQSRQDMAAVRPYPAKPAPIAMPGPYPGGTAASRVMAMETMPPARSYSPVGFARGPTPPSAMSPHRVSSTLGYSQSPNPNVYAAPGIPTYYATENPLGGHEGPLSWMTASTEEASTYTPRTSFDAVMEEEEEDALWQDRHHDDDEAEEMTSPTNFLRHRGSIVAAHAPLLRVINVPETGVESDDNSENSDDDDALNQIHQGYAYGASPEDFQVDYIDAEDDEYDFRASEYLEPDEPQHLPPSPLDPFPPLISATTTTVPPGPYTPRHHKSRDSVTSVRSVLRKRSSFTESDLSSVPPSPMVNKRVSFDENVERREQERMEKLRRREERKKRREAERQAREKQREAERQGYI